MELEEERHGRSLTEAGSKGGQCEADEKQGPSQDARKLDAPRQALLAISEYGHPESETEMDNAEELHGRIRQGGRPVG